MTFARPGGYEGRKDDKTMAKLEIRYWSELNLCWTERMIEFASREEAKEHLDYCLRHDRVKWAKIDGKTVQCI